MWNIQTGKCERSFRHRHPVLAVALSADVCITGCQGGRVMVWELASGQLIKVYFSSKNLYIAVPDLFGLYIFLIFEFLPLFTDLHDPFQF